MKKFNRIALLFLLGCGLVYGCSTIPTIVTFENPRQIKHIKTVAVLPFTCNISATGQIITDALAQDLKTSRFEVIEQSQLDSLLKAQSLTLKRISENFRPAVGKLKGVDAVITGSASVRAFRGYTDHVAESTARMIDVATGEILMEVDFSSENVRSLQGTVPAEQIGKGFAEKFSLY